jgi:adenosine 3'-phospho 5'-phosphosulfate transporter B2
VSFPTAMLAKAFKVMPVMIMGVFMHNKSYESYEYLSAALVGFGLYLFMDSSEHINFKENVFFQSESMDGAICGVVLLILFLFFDSFTGQWQTRMFQINKSMSPLQMMLIMNAFSCVFSFITLVHQEELNIALQFVYKHPEIIIHLIIFCITSTVGQLFIFYTVKNFGAVVFSIIMSLRILFSTVLSCVIYSHPITELGFLGIAIVFGAIAYRIRRKTEGKPLIRWRETEDGKRDIMHEWHEHLDV